MTIKSVESGNPIKSVIQTSYDIITKGHDGQLEVETREGEGSAFVIQLPII
jgi:hypothetical protein